MTTYKNKMEVERIDLESLVSSQIPEYRKYPPERKYRLKCPHCGNDKSPALSVLRNMRVGICFRCEILFINDDTAGTLDSESISQALEGFTRKTHQGLQVLNGSIFDLYEPVHDNEFLNHRNPYVKDWNYYGIRQAPNEVITPYYLFGNLVYYQIRGYNPRRFNNPRGIEAPIYIPSDVHTSPGLWYPDAPTVIGEGPFSMIAYDCVRRYTGKRFNIAGLGGKVLTDYRENLFRLLGLEHVTLNLDETRLSQELKQDMKERRLGRRINIVPSDGDDPEEVLVKVGLKKFSDFVLPYIFDDDTWRDSKRVIYDSEQVLSSEKLQLS